MIVVVVVIVLVLVLVCCTAAIAFALTTVLRSLPSPSQVLFLLHRITAAAVTKHAATAHLQKHILVLLFVFVSVLTDAVSILSHHPVLLLLLLLQFDNASP